MAWLRYWAPTIWSATGEAGAARESDALKEAAGRKCETFVYQALHPKDADKYIRPGYDFGHPMFGAYHGFNVPLGDDGLPYMVDWTEIPGAVWDAQDQDSQSAICYLYSSLGAARSLNYIKTGESVDLSLQHVIDCNTLTGGDLDGGTPEKVWEFIIKNGGILPSALYPFTGQKGVCKNITGRGVTIDAWKPILPNDEYALKFAVAHQPVVVGVRIGARFYGKVDFAKHRKGILSGPSYFKLDHSVLLVGYGETNLGELYRILLNSYGCRWGDKGLFWIARNTGQQGGALGILREPCVPLKWSDNGLVTSKCESCANCFSCKDD
ncbi:hypothetical protein ACQJBY_006190 [Aegilops geniculata]